MASFSQKRLHRHDVGKGQTFFGPGKIREWKGENPECRHQIGQSGVASRRGSALNSLEIAQLH